jgi:hypothetical protein
MMPAVMIGRRRLPPARPGLVLAIKKGKRNGSIAEKVARKKGFGEPQAEPAEPAPEGEPEGPHPSMAGRNPTQRIFGD